LSHLKKKSLVPVAFAALTAVTWLAPLPALGQTSGLFGRSQTIDSLGRNATSTQNNGLRGGFEPGDEISRLDDEDSDRRRRGEDGQISGNSQGEDAILLPDAENTAIQTTLRPERGDDAEEDPFAPLGIRVGSFLLFPS